MKIINKKILIFLIILVCSILFLTNFFRYKFLQEDLLFFQFLNSNNYIKTVINKGNETKVENENDNIVTINLKVKYKGTSFKTLNLAKTTDNKTLINEKIAPGTKGSFNILLNSNKNMNYKIQFKSVNKKPTNLQFYIKEEKKYNNLEELEEDLQGVILEKEKKIITIYWEWIYEISEEQNEKDTLEAKKIREYNFLIYVKGY